MEKGKRLRNGRLGPWCWGGGRSGVRLLITARAMGAVCLRAVWVFWQRGDVYAVQMGESGGWGVCSVGTGLLLVVSKRIDQSAVFSSLSNSLFHAV